VGAFFSRSGVCRQLRPHLDPLSAAQGRSKKGPVYGAVDLAVASCGAVGSRSIVGMVRPREQYPLYNRRDGVAFLSKRSAPGTSGPELAAKEPGAAHVQWPESTLALEDPVLASGLVTAAATTPQKPASKRNGVRSDFAKRAQQQTQYEMSGGVPSHPAFFFCRFRCVASPPVRPYFRSLPFVLSPFALSLRPGFGGPRRPVGFGARAWGPPALKHQAGSLNGRATRLKKPRSKPVFKLICYFSTTLFFFLSKSIIQLSYLKLKY